MAAWRQLNNNIKASQLTSPGSNERSTGLKTQNGVVAFPSATRQLTIRLREVVIAPLMISDV